MARYAIVRKVKDKYGKVWERDKYGGWTNEWGVRFTKTEHRRYGYIIRKANKAIQAYREKYPTLRANKADDIANRYRSDDLSKFHRKSSYRRYLRTTQRIITGEQFYIRQPKQFIDNYIKSLNNNVINNVIRNRPDLQEYRTKLIDKLKSLSPEEVIQFSRDVKTPEINEWYIPSTDIIETDFDTIFSVIDSVV